MTTTTSHGNPMAEISDGECTTRVYEEIPGSLTVSFSRGPGMWSGFTVPVESAHLVNEAIDAALAARSRLGVPCPDCGVPMTTEDGLRYCAGCDAYHGEADDAESGEDHR